MDRISIPPLLIQRPCDEGALVYSEESGATCLVNQSYAAILDLLGDSAARPVDEVFIEYSAHDDIDRPAFDTLVASLEESGLILRC